MRRTLIFKILFIFIITTAVLFFVLAPLKIKALDCCICKIGDEVKSCPDIRIPGQLCSQFNDPIRGLYCSGPHQGCENFKDCVEWYQKSGVELPGVPKVPKEEKERPFVPPKLQIPIPGLIFTTEESKLKICTECEDPDVVDPADCPKEKCKSWAYEIPWIGEYLLAIYKWLVGSAAVLAVIIIMINGVRWILAGGSPEKISEAKKGISSAIIGLVLVLLIQQFFSIIDPRLTVFKPIRIGIIKKIPYDIQVVNQGSDSDGASLPENNCVDETKLVKIEKNKFGGVTAADPRLLPDVYERLLEAQSLAKAEGKNILITSAFRTLSHQKKLWEAALKKYGSETTTRKYVAYPSCQAPHLTGRAIDVCLANTPSCGKINGANAYYSDSDVVALQNFMTKAGFVRYCGEWWHFEYGTNRWERGKDLPPGPNRCK